MFHLRRELCPCDPEVVREGEHHDSDHVSEPIESCNIIV